MGRDRPGHALPREARRARARRGPSGRGRGPVPRVPRWRADPLASLLHAGRDGDSEGRPRARRPAGGPPRRRRRRRRSIGAARSSGESPASRCSSGRARASSPRCSPGCSPARPAPRPRVPPCSRACTTPSASRRSPTAAWATATTTRSSRCCSRSPCCSSRWRRATASARRDAKRRSAASPASSPASCSARGSPRWVYVLLLQLTLGWFLFAHRREPSPGLAPFGLAFHALALATSLPAILASPWRGTFPWMVVNLSWFHAAHLALGALVFVPLLGPWGRRSRARAVYPLALTGALLLLAILIVAIDAGPGRGIREGFEWVSRADQFMAGIQESRPLLTTSTFDGAEIRRLLGDGAVLLPLAWILAGVAAVRGRRAELVPLFVSVPFLAMQAGSQARFADALAAPMAVLVGWGLTRAVTAAAQRFGPAPESAGRRTAARVSPLLAIGLAAGLAALAWRPVVVPVWRAVADERLRPAPHSAPGRGGPRDARVAPDEHAAHPRLLGARELEPGPRDRVGRGPRERRDQLRQLRGLRQLRRPGALLPRGERRGGRGRAVGAACPLRRDHQQLAQCPAGHDPRRLPRARRALPRDVFRALRSAASGLVPNDRSAPHVRGRRPPRGRNRGRPPRLRAARARLAFERPAPHARAVRRRVEPRRLGVGARPRCAPRGPDGTGSRAGGRARARVRGRRPAFPLPRKRDRR